MNYYLVKFKQKRELRLLLCYNHTQNIKHSSLYKIEDFYYILLQADKVIDFPTNTLLTACVIHLQPGFYKEISVIPEQAGIHKEKSIFSENITTTEEYLFNWAQSEIMQSTDYIRFEQNSKFVSIGRMASCEGITIYRLYEQLADIFAALNYTPDSFSDGGRFNQIDNAIAQIERLCGSGAAIIDLGAESTRPARNVALSANDEIKILREILPHVLELKSELKFELSIDTYHSETVLWLIDFAVDIINDVSGKLSLGVVKQILNNDRRYVAMHSLSIPANPDIVLDENSNPLKYLYNWLTNKIEAVADAGCDISKLILDPGIGFGLTASQSWYVIRHLGQLQKLPCEILVGNSRKSFLNHITAIDFAGRDLESAIVAARILPHADYLRLHDLELFNRVLPVFNQLI
jgi:dihydropteroate synthase